MTARDLYKKLIREGYILTVEDGEMRVDPPEGGTRLPVAGARQVVTNREALLALVGEAVEAIPAAVEASPDLQESTAYIQSMLPVAIEDKPHVQTGVTCRQPGVDLQLSNAARGEALSIGEENPAGVLYTRLRAQGFVIMGTEDSSRVKVQHPDGKDVPPELDQQIRTHEAALLQLVRQDQWRDAVEWSIEMQDRGIPYHGPERSWQGWLLAVAKGIGNVLVVQADGETYHVRLDALGEIRDWSQSRVWFRADEHHPAGQPKSAQVLYADLMAADFRFQGRGEGRVQVVHPDAEVPLFLARRVRAHEAELSRLMCRDQWKEVDGLLHSVGWQEWLPPAEPMGAPNRKEVDSQQTTATWYEEL